MCICTFGAKSSSTFPGRRRYRGSTTINTFRTTLPRKDVLRRAAVIRTRNRGASQAADDPEAILQSRDTHAASRSSQVVRLVFSRTGWRRGAPRQVATRVPTAEYSLRFNVGISQSTASTIWKYDANVSYEVSQFFYIIIYIKLLLK